MGWRPHLGADAARRWVREAQSLLTMTAPTSRFHATRVDLSGGPPPEVRAEIDVAWERAQALQEAGLELRFEVDPDRGHAWAELRRVDGTESVRLTPAEALRIACGGDLPKGFGAEWA